MNTAIEDGVHQWWSEISRDAGARARLRHETEIVGMQLNESFYDLVRKVPNANIDTLACIAIAVCHVDSDSKESVARRMGKKSKGSDHTVSEMRFRRLIEADRYEASRMLVTLLPMVDSTANVRDLAKSIYYWNNDEKFSQKNWIKHYYLANEKEEQ